MLLLFCFQMAALADDTKNQLVIWAIDGSKTVYPLSSNPEISFTEADLIVKANDIEGIFSIEETKGFSYEYSDDIKCTVVLGSSMITFCSPLDLDFSSVNGLKAYIASSFDPETGKMTMDRINVVPAGTGILLVGQANSYEVPITTNQTASVGENLLKGVTIATEISPTDGIYTNYILAAGSNGISFYRLSTTGLLAAGKAYLQLPTSASASRQTIRFSFDDNSTDIYLLDNEDADADYFRLDGIRVPNPSRKGIYMKNGKKVVVK